MAPVPHPSPLGTAARPGLKPSLTPPSPTYPSADCHAVVARSRRRTTAPGSQTGDRVRGPQDGSAGREGAQGLVRSHAGEGPLPGAVVGDLLVAAQRPPVLDRRGLGVLRALLGLLLLDELGQ